MSGALHPALGPIVTGGGTPARLAAAAGAITERMGRMLLPPPARFLDEDGLAALTDPPEPGEALAAVLARLGGVAAEEPPADRPPCAGRPDDARHYRRCGAASRGYRRARPRRAAAAASRTARHDRTDGRRTVADVAARRRGAASRAEKVDGSTARRVRQPVCRSASLARGGGPARLGAPNPRGRRSAETLARDRSGRRSGYRPAPPSRYFAPYRRAEDTHPRHRSARRLATPTRLSGRLERDAACPARRTGDRRRRGDAGDPLDARNGGRTAAPPVPCRRDLRTGRKARRAARRLAPRWCAGRRLCRAGRAWPRRAARSCVRSPAPASVPERAVEARALAPARPAEQPPAPDARAVIAELADVLRLQILAAGIDPSGRRP